MPESIVAIRVDPLLSDHGDGPGAPAPVPAVSRPAPPDEAHSAFGLPPGMAGESWGPPTARPARLVSTVVAAAVLGIGSVVFIGAATSHSHATGTGGGPGGFGGRAGAGFPAGGAGGPGRFGGPPPGAG